MGFYGVTWLILDSLWSFRIYLGYFLYFVLPFMFSGHVALCSTTSSNFAYFGGNILYFMLLLRVLGSRGLIYGSFKVVFHTFCDCVRHFGATLLGFIGKNNH